MPSAQAIQNRFYTMNSYKVGFGLITYEARKKTSANQCRETRDLTIPEFDFNKFISTWRSVLLR